MYELKRCTVRLEMSFKFPPVDAEMADYRGWKFTPDEITVTIYGWVSGSIGYASVSGKRSSGMISRMGFTIYEQGLEMMDHAGKPTPEWLGRLWAQIAQDYAEDISKIRTIKAL